MFFMDVFPYLLLFFSEQWNAVQPMINAWIINVFFPLSSFYHFVLLDVVSLDFSFLAIKTIIKRWVLARIKSVELLIDYFYDYRQWY